MLGGDLIWRPAVQHTLATGVVGHTEAVQQLFERAVRVNIDVEHLAGYPAVESLDHAVGLRRAGLCMAVLRAQLGAGFGKGRRKAAAIVSQNVGELEGKGCCSLVQEGDGATFGFVILDGEVDGARAAVDGDKQVSFAPVTVAGLQLGQMLDVDMDKAKVVVAEGTLALGGTVRGRLFPAVQAFCFEDAPDAVAIEMRQEMRDDEGEVIEREVGGTPQRADDGALLFCGFPGQPVRSGGAVEAVFRAAFAPFAHRFGADAVSLGDNAAGLGGSGDLGADSRGSAGIWVDVQHGSPLS